MPSTAATKAMISILSESPGFVYCEVFFFKLAIKNQKKKVNLGYTFYGCGVSFTSSKNINKQGANKF